ncbi:MAG: DUF1365 family protein, partial [Pseudomonadota bacterium]
MATRIDHIAGVTFHGRKGAVKNAFSYSVDYILLDAEAELRRPWAFGRNAGGLFSVQDGDHGGPPGKGRGAAWVRDVLAERGLPSPARVELLAQPKILGHVFNP